MGIDIGRTSECEGEKLLFLAPPFVGLEIGIPRAVAVARCRIRRLLTREQGVDCPRTRQRRV